MDEQRARDYADYFVWAKRNLTSTPEICHAAAQAAVDAKASGQDPQPAMRSAAMTRSGPGWQDKADADTRRYAEWYDWARLELGTSGDDSHRAAAAAVASLQTNLDSGAAADAARRAVGKETVAAGVPSAPPVQPGPAGPPIAPPTAPPPAPQQQYGQQQYGQPYTPAPPPPAAPGGYPYSGSPGPSTPPAGPGYPAFPATPGGYYGAYTQGGTDGMAIGALICALAGILLAFCYGVPGILLGAVALILGRVSLGRIRSSGGYKTGSGLAQAGWIIGVVDMALGALVLIGFIVLIVIGSTSGSGTSG